MWFCMFPELSFRDVNREEQAYCSLFAHALIASSEVRDFFFNKCGIELKGEEVEVYVEPAPLRDYWYALGDPKKHSKATEMARKQVLSQFIEHYQVGLDIDETDFFWTVNTKSSNGKGKLRSPGIWESENIRQAELERLFILKYAFNSKLDIMLLTESHVIFIEAKLESAESSYGVSRFTQTEIQNEIGKLITEFIPAFKPLKYLRFTLGFKAKPDISWHEVHQWVGASPLDQHTKRSFHALCNRYPMK
ncbi:hypothetical protein G3485_12820 [Shewanella baltica]|nr:hypothetical protein [Shewanella baltica]MCS6139943.1 hypothetical protein [Shewanella baltica]MCS6146084.1 hypothetical protein [Shewanella baltica]MCS6170614.1 hypothetical protein [Shewanella baltica]MCS6187841.1 hypothetical protein [Shewanella baltica]